MDLEAKLNGVKVKCKEEVKSTFRFDINLDNPTDTSSNEIHYTELLHEKTHKQHEKEMDAPDPFEKDEDAEVAAIAKRPEEKFARPKKVRKVREEDLVDLGDGYDLNDPFVDDAEVYEDFVPHQVDTLLGGFYINAGSLEYKKADGSLDLPLKRKQKPSFKKQSSTPKALLASKKIKLAKQQIAISAQRTEIIKKKLSTFSKSNPKSLFSSTKTNGNKITTTITISSGNKPKDVGVVTDMAVATTGSVVNVSDQSLPKESEFKVPPILPVDIPPGIETRVKHIETMVQKAHGKLTVKARYEYDAILLQIESECKNMKMKTRTAVFDYLAYVMGITRGSLMNRIKRTIKKQKGTDASETPLQLLKEAIDEIMPKYVGKYEADLAEYELALKKEQESNQTIEGNVPQSPLGVKVPIEKPKKPRRIIKWTPSFKSLLCDVVRQKVETEMASKTPSAASGEEVILEFLQTTIKPLWPNGWFIKRNIYNLTQSVHSEFTGYNPQKKVPIKKPVEVKSEEGSLPLPPTQVIPPFEGSTQASLGSIFDSISNPTSCPETTPTMPSITSPISGSSSKQTLLPANYFHSSNTTISQPITTTIKEKQQAKIVLPKQPLSNLVATTKTKAIPSTATIPKTVAVSNQRSTMTVPAVSTVMSTQAKVIRNKINSHKNMVLQKAPAKITKITTPKNLNLSQQQIDAIIDTIKNSSVSFSPQQQVHVVVQPNTSNISQTTQQNSVPSCTVVTHATKPHILSSSQVPVRKPVGSINLTHVPTLPRSISQTPPRTMSPVVVPSKTTKQNHGTIMSPKMFSTPPTPKSLATVKTLTSPSTVKGMATPPNVKGPPPYVKGPPPYVKGPPPYVKGPPPNVKGPPPNVFDILGGPPPNVIYSSSSANKIINSTLSLITNPTTIFTSPLVPGAASNMARIRTPPSISNIPAITPSRTNNTSMMNLPSPTNTRVIQAGPYSLGGQGVHTVVGSGPYTHSGSGSYSSQSNSISTEHNYSPSLITGPTGYPMTLPLTHVHMSPNSTIPSDSIPPMQLYRLFENNNSTEKNT